MTTITVQVTGSQLPGLTTNPSKSYTISDADLQALLTWAANAFGVVGQPNGQILLTWLQNTLIGPTISGVQAFNRVVPPPISIA